MNIENTIIINYNSHLPSYHSTRRKILLSRNLPRIQSIQHDCVSRVRERGAEFHQRRETIPIFVKGMPVPFTVDEIGTVEKEKRKRGLL